MPAPPVDPIALVKEFEGKLPRLEFLARLDALVAEYPENETLRGRQTLSHFAMGDREGALKLAEAHLQAHRSPEALAARGRIAISNGEFDAAKSLLDEALAANPRPAVVSSFAGDFAMLAGDFDGAIKYAEEALATKPENPNYESGVLKALLHAGRLTEAEYRWQTAESWFKDSYAYWLTTGHLDLQRHDLTAAEAAYRSALALEPYSSTAWARLGGVLIIEKRLQEAETAARNSLDESPENAQALKLLSMIARKRGRLVEADEYQARAAANGPNLKGGLHVQEACGFVDRGEWDAAFRALSLAYRDSPVGLHGYIRRLHVRWLAASERWSELEAILPLVAPTDASSAEVILARARLLHHQKRASEAIALLEQPTDAPSVANDAFLLRLYGETGAIEKVESLAQSLAGTTAGAPGDFWAAVTALHKVGKPELADQLLERALRLYPNSDLLKMSEARRLIRSGAPEQARRIIAGLPPKMREAFYPRHSPWNLKYWKRVGRVIKFLVRKRPKP